MVDEGKFILGLVDLVKKISFNGFVADFFVAVFIGIIAKCAGSTFINYTSVVGHDDKVLVKDYLKGKGIEV